MHLFIISQYYPPETGALASRWGDYTKLLNNQNHEVTVLCESPHYPYENYYPGYKNSFFSLERETSNLTIVRTKAFASNRNSFVKKICHYLVFMFSAILNLKRIKNYDILIISSPPLFTGIIGLYAKIFLKKNFWLDVRDLWPDSALELGQISNGFLFKCGKFLEKKIYLNSSGFIFPIPGFRKYLKTFLPEISNKPMITLMNGVSKNFLNHAAKIDNSDNERFTVLYSGNMGLAQDLSTIIEAANLLKDHKIDFSFVGHGVCREETKKKAISLGVKIKFWDPLPRKDLIECIKKSSVCLVPLKKKKLFNTALPSKLFEYMACGKPVIVGINGEAESIIKASKSGICVQPENPEMLSKAILTYLNDKEKRKIDGENGLRYVTKNLQKEYLISNLIKELNRSLE